MTRVVIYKRKSSLSEDAEFVCGTMLQSDRNRLEYESFSVVHWRSYP